MEIRVSGHQVDVGAALKAHVEERLQAIATKNARPVEVTLALAGGDVGGRDGA